MRRHLDDIILIGPIGAGKSTVGTLLAEALRLPQVRMDEVRRQYYAEIGYTRAQEDQLRETGGFEAVYWYWKPFEVHAVQRVLADHRNCVIDFGAGHSVYEDPRLFERARRALAPYRNVILLLPSPDPDESVRVLRERSRAEEAGGEALAQCDFLLRRELAIRVVELLARVDRLVEDRPEVDRLRGGHRERERRGEHPCGAPHRDSPLPDSPGAGMRASASLASRANRSADPRSAR